MLQVSRKMLVKHTMILYELCNEFLGYITFFTLMNFCIDKNLGWLVLRDIDNKIKISYMDVSRLSPSILSSFLVLILLWEILLLFLFCYSKGCLSVLYFEWPFTHTWFCAIMHWPFGRYWFTESCGFYADGFLFKKNIKMSHLLVSPLIWEILSIRNLSSSQWWIQVFKHLISYQKLKFYYWQHWWHLKDRLSSFLKKCLLDSPAWITGVCHFFKVNMMFHEKGAHSVHTSMVAQIFSWESIELGYVAQVGVLYMYVLFWHIEFQTNMYSEEIR